MYYLFDTLRCEVISDTSRDEEPPSFSLKIFSGKLSLRCMYVIVESREHRFELLILVIA